MSRSWKIISWVVSTSVMLAALIFAAVTIWAISGPRDLSQYNKFVEDSVNEKLTGKHVKIGKTYLSWKALDELMALDVSDVTLLDNDNKQIAYFPKVVLRYRFLSLIRGQITPSVVKLVNPQIDLTGIDFEAEGGSKLDLNTYNIDQFDSIVIQNGTLITPENGTWDVVNAEMRYDNNFLYISGEMKNKGESAKLSYYTNLDQSDKGFNTSLTNFDGYELRKYLPEAAKSHVLINGGFSYVTSDKENKTSFNFTSITGDIDDPDLFDDKFNIAEGKVTGSYDFNTKKLEIGDIEMGFADGFKLLAKGETDDFKSYDIEASIANLKISSLVKYWPKPVKLDAIPWLKQRVSDGIITGAKAVVKISPEEIANHKILKNSVNIKYTFKDIDLKYSDKLTDIKNGSGSGIIDGDSVKNILESGTSGNSKLLNGVAEIRDVNGPNERLYVSASVQGSAADLSEFYLNTGTGNKVVSSKADVSGEAVSQAELNLPLAKDLKLDDVNYHVKTQITNGSAKNLVNKFDVTGINCAIEADNNSYRIYGQGVATYNKTSDGFALTAAPVSFDVVGQNGNLKINTASDITNSTITLAPVEVVKKAGDAGKLAIEIVSANGQKPQLSKFMLDSDAFKIAASGELTQDYNSIDNLQISKLQFGKTDLTGRLMMTPYLTAEFKGSTFDMQPVLRYLKTRKNSDDDSEYKLLLQADNVILLNQQSLKDVELSIHCAKIGCDEFSLHSHNVAVDQSGGTLNAKISEVGNLLNGFGLYENMVKGTMTVTAKVAGKAYDGTIIITDFYIVKARVLAKMMTLGSLTGIADMVVGNGIRFNKLTADVKMDQHNVSVENYRMVGPAIGITANGIINRDNDIVAVKGNIIPAYTANTLLGRIPLIGSAIFSNDGVFALAYTMKGNIENPDLSVNPLTVLAPGSLRRIFE